MTSNDIYNHELQSLITKTIENHKHEDFIPTYLYIKQHSVTGKLYFGKTSKSLDYLLNEYDGGGSYWNSHIKKHNIKHVETIWYCLFLDRDSLVCFALSYCYLHKIGFGDIHIWANLMLENGLDGSVCGRPGSMKDKKHTANSLKKIGNRKYATGIDHYESISVKIDGTIFSSISEASKVLMIPSRVISEMLRGIIKTSRKYQITLVEYAETDKIDALKEVHCPYCGKIGRGNAMKQWHFDNCKYRYHIDSIEYQTIQKLRNASSKKSNKTQMKPIVINEISYESINHACRVLSIGENVIYNLLKSGKQTHEKHDIKSIRYLIS